MSTLPDELDRLRAAIAWPDTPDASEAVIARLREAHELAARGGAGARRRAPRLRRLAPRRVRRGRFAPRLAPRRVPLGPFAPRLAWVLCALAVLLTGTVAAIPDARSAVLEFLGLKSARIERREPRPGLGSRLDIGRRMTLAQARQTVGFDVRVPDLPGAEVYADADLPVGGQVSFLAAGPLLVSEYDARISPVIMKAVGAGSTIEELIIDGRPAFWLTGAKHEFAYVDRTGNVAPDRARLAGDVLLYESDRLLIRIEGARSREEAVQLARSLR